MCGLYEGQFNYGGNPADVRRAPAILREATSQAGELAHQFGDCRDPSERSVDGCAKQRAKLGSLLTELATAATRRSEAESGARSEEPTRGACLPVWRTFVWIHLHLGIIVVW